MYQFSVQPKRQFVRLILVFLTAVGSLSSLQAGDYIVTIGGGYNPSGNQASLEANVLFFQSVLKDLPESPAKHTIFFSDGDDPKPDLQVMQESATSDSPATDLIRTLRRRPSESRLAYRNHRINDIEGPTDPKRIKKEIENLASALHKGDRVIVYVTAHGSPGSRKDSFNTTIDCWGRKKITAREFASWLDSLPNDVPVVMVMAQCYCGGFAMTIFNDLDESEGLAPQLRAGFFAQQYDLPAAGCRPDIEHDEEFSSYFWGAIAGRSRNGVPIQNCDINSDGSISFAEAYVYAVIAGETIDIPLQTSDALLRKYSHLTIGDSDTPVSESDDEEQTEFSTLKGTLKSFANRGRPVTSKIVSELAQALGFAIDSDVSVVKDEFWKTRSSLGGPRNGRGPRGSGRRELLQEISEKWPELGDNENWEKSTLLEAENQQDLLSEIHQMPSWKNYDARRQQNESNQKRSQQSEIRNIKLRRLLHALETIDLAVNLPNAATPEILEHYQRLISLEESSLNFIPQGN